LLAIGLSYAAAVGYALCNAAFAGRDGIEAQRVAS
jgi:hypothetical protein